MKTYTVSIDGEELQIGIEDGRVVTVNGEPEGSIAVEQTAKQQYSVLIDGISYAIVAALSDGRLEALSHGRRYEPQVYSERERFRKQLATPANLPARTEIRAPMPALVVKVEVQPGDEVREGQGLVVLEAMKMENEIRAHAGARVKEVYATAGKAVEKDELLILLE